MKRHTLKKAAPLQPEVSARAIAEQRSMALQRAINRMKLDSTSSTMFATPQQTYSIPKPPPGVIPKGVSMAMDDAANSYGTWAMQNSIFAEGQMFLGYPYLAELSQRPEYRVISETWAQEMTRKWIRLVSTGDTALDDKSDKLKHIEAVMKKLKVQECFRKCIEIDGFFGRSQIFIDLGVTSNDRDELKTSIGAGTNTDRLSKIKIKKGSLKHLRVIEPIWTYPNTYNSNDPLKPDFFKPTTWFVMGKEIHSTRLLTFVGRPVADLLKPMYSFGGLSLSQMAKPYIDNWLRTRQSVSDAISNFSIMMLLTDMSSMLEAGATTDLVQRAEFFNITRDNRGLMLGDKETEELTNVSTPLSGLDHLQAQSQEHMSAVSGIPLVKLTGVSPSGLNATSEYEVSVFYDKVEAQQESYLTENLSTILNMIQLSEFGEIDPEIGFVYEPLQAIDPAEEATKQKAEADTDGVYINLGVISPLESRTRLASDKNSAYASLDTSPEALPEPPQQPGQETDENGKSVGSESPDIANGGEQDKPASTQGAVAQGEGKTKIANRPITSKPVAGAHDIALDFNPNHDTDTGEFAKGTGEVSGRKNVSTSKGLPVDTDGNVELTHYSNKQDITALNPHMYGSGLRGAESKRLQADPHNWVSRSYHGIGEYKKEAGLGNIKYTSKVPADKLYDFARDPDQLRDKDVGDDNETNVYEKAIKKAGYLGYYVNSPQFGGIVAATFESLPVTQAADDWNESLHPRGQPENKGEFSKSSGGSENSSKELADKHGTFYKSLGIARASMPQIRSQDHAEFKDFAKENGVSITEEKADISSLHPAQMHCNPEQVKGMSPEALKLPIMISKDSYVLDGTNRFMRIMQDTPDKQVDVKRIDLPVKEALALMLSFPKAFAKSVDQVGSTVEVKKRPLKTLPDDSPLLVESRTDHSAEAQSERVSIGLHAFAKAKPVTGRKPIIYVMGGGSGAGKGTLLKKLQEQGVVPTRDQGAVIIDPDAIKTSLHRYKQIFAAGDYRASMTVHEDASAQSKNILRAAKEGHYDIVFDVTMKDHDKGISRIKEFQAAGYEVKMYNVVADTDTALERAMDRYKRTGRYVDPEVLRNAHSNFNAALPDYEKIVDHFQTYSNNDTLRLERSSDNKVAGDAWEEDKHPRGQPENAGEFASTGGGNKIVEGAKAFAAMPQSKIDNMDWDAIHKAGGKAAYELYEAQKFVPKPADKLKRLTGETTFSLHDEYDSIANIDGHHFGVCRYEDPDEPEDDSKYIYAFKPLDVDEGTTGMHETTTDDREELFAEMRKYNSTRAKQEEPVIKLSSAGDKEANKKRLKPFFTDLLAASQRNPLDERELIIGKAGVELSMTVEGNVHLSFIRSLEQGAGHASKALDKVCELADKHNVTLDLEAAPMPNHVKDKKAALSKKQLIEWYTRHGFEHVSKRGEGNYMLRKPQQNKSVDTEQLKKEILAHIKGKRGERQTLLTSKQIKDYFKQHDPDDIEDALLQLQIEGLAHSSYASLRTGHNSVNRKVVWEVLEKKLAGDDWNESEHPRGQPENAGEFAPKLEVDNPGGKWLQQQKQRSKDGGRTVHGVPNHFGEVTGSFSRKVSVPMSKLSQVPGMKDEQHNVRQGDLARLKHHMGKTGHLPLMTNSQKEYVPFVQVDREGKPWMNEGNHRVMAAQQLGWKHMPAEVRYFSGGEQAQGAWHPDTLLKDHEQLQGLERSAPHKLLQKRALTANAQRKVLFEVAPNPNDKDLSAHWNALDAIAKTTISSKVLQDILPDVLKKTGVKAKMHLQYCGYLDDTNPSVSLVLDPNTTDEQADALTRILGSTLEQDSMTRVSKKPFAGSSEMGAVVIQVPKNISFKDVETLYNMLRGSIGDDISGHTTDAGRMVILVDKYKVDSIGRKVSQVLGDDYDVGYDTLNVAWPEKGADDYGLQREDQSGQGSTGSSVGQWLNLVRAKATSLRQQQIEQYEAEGQQRTGTG